MKNAAFRILVSLVMVVGLVILNSNFQLPVANEGESTTTCVVEEELEVRQQAKDERTEVIEESKLQKAEKYVAWMTEIGRDLGVSDSTLKKYVKVLLERLGLDEYTYLVDSV